MLNLTQLYVSSFFLHFKVYCNGRRAYNKSFQQNNEVVLDENARSTLIKKGLLKPGTEYSVYVRATTVKGYGSRSDPVVLKTPSKGILKLYLFVCFLLFVCLFVSVCNPATSFFLTNHRKLPSFMALLQSLN